MVRRLDLLIRVVIATGVLIALSSSPVASASPLICSTTELKLGRCTSGLTDGSAVELQGTAQSKTPGSPGRDGRRGSAELPDSNTTKRKPLTPAQVRAALVMEELCAGVTPCTQQAAFTWGQDEVPDDADPVPAGAAQVVAIDDVARFLPAAATLHAEPDGWAVVGVPANFWVDVTPVTVDGELLGEAAQVRFTPRGYRFEYGDGGTRTTASAGASWATLGQEELTETATSHLYDDRGDHRAVVTVFYSAEYRFAGGPWIAIDGAVAGQAPPVRELVVVERTVLTAPTTG